MRQSEVDSLRDIGRFRVVEAPDLERFGYAGDAVRMREDVRSLREQGLIERRRLSLDSGERLDILTLTAQGRHVIEGLEPAGSRQNYYDGFVKTNEAEHDAAFYRMFQAEASKIRERGGVVGRVFLDFELKRDAYAELAKQDREGPETYRERQGSIAAAHRLQVVRGRIQFPDVRIEYQDAEGRSGRVDLEPTTAHYKIRPAYVFSYRRSSWRFSSMALRQVFPQTLPYSLIVRPR